MKETLHTCAAIGCKARIGKRFLMCKYHWSRVPASIRDAVWSTWSEVQSTGQITEAYANAVIAAKESLK